MKSKIFSDSSLQREKSGDDNGVFIMAFELKGNVVEIINKSNWYLRSRSLCNAVIMHEQISTTGNLREDIF